MNSRDEVIEELVSLILMQDEELKKLQETINRIKEYIKIYEDYIKEGRY